MGAADGKKKNRIGKIIGIFLICVFIAIAAVSAVGVGVWNALVSPPDLSDIWSGTGNAAGEDAGTTNARKDGFYTFLLLGSGDSGDETTDTMLLAAYDVAGGTLDLLSIPGDTIINVSWDIKKISGVYASPLGLRGLRTEVGHLTGIVPDFYVAIEWEAIGEIVDALGGVWFYVPYHMDYDDPYEDLHIHQEKGYRLLSGDDAMQVIRWRRNNGDAPGNDDSKRQQVQQEFFKAVAQQCLQIKNWTKVSTFTEIIFDNVETDVPWNNLLWFAQKAMGLNAGSITFHSLPGSGDGRYYTPRLDTELSYFFADPKGIVELINAHFNPLTRNITEENLQIVFKNEDESLGVTNGELADPGMAEPSIRPGSENADSPASNENEENTEDTNE